MSEDEENLVENIIKVFVTTKGEAKKKSFSKIKKEKNPKILVTDHSNTNLKDFVTLALAETSGAINREPKEEKPTENLLKSGTEFESEPSDLMPDSFLSYLSSCKNLIGDISNFKEERLDADDWIGQFDQTITDAQNEAKEAEEFERLHLLKIEERRKKLEQRRLMRKINKPLINQIPKLLGSYNTFHDKVCLVPLEQLKRSLKRYQPTLDLRFQNLENANILERKLKSTCKVITMLNSSFAKFLKIEMRKKEKLSQLYVIGKCLVSPRKCEDVHGKTKLVVAKEKREQRGEILLLEDVLCIKCVTKEEKFAKPTGIEKPRFRWSYDKKEGVLKNISKRQSFPLKANKGHGKPDLAKSRKRTYNKKHKENFLKKIILAEQEKILKFMNKAKYLFNEFEHSKMLAPQTKSKQKFLLKTSFQVQFVDAVYLLIC